METLLIIGSGAQIYREYILRSLSSVYRLVIVQTTPATWQKNYSSDIIQVTDMQQASFFHLLKEMQQKYHFAGVLTYDEGLVETTARIAEEMQLPGIRQSCAQSCRDKFLMRQAFKRAGVPSASSFLVNSVEEALACADTIGYPVVLKPRALAGSIGVVRADTAKDVISMYTTTMTARDERFAGVHGVLIEEYLDGPEISVEAVVAHGVPTIVAITQKQTGELPYFEEVGHVVTAQEPHPDESSIQKVVLAAHQALAIDVGITHTEIRLTPNGPHIIEIAARLAGDLIPYLVYLATGVDLARCAADVATGKTPHLAHSRAQAAAIQFLYPQQNVHVGSLTVDTTAQHAPWLDQITWKAHPGDILRLPPQGFLSRLGFIVVTGSTNQDCQTNLQKAQQFIRMELIPL